MNEFGRRLKLLREQKDLPLSKLAEDVSTTKSALSRYENGKMEPGLKMMVKLAEYFDVTLDWLAGNGNDEDYVNLHFGDRESRSSKTDDHYEMIINKCIKNDISPDKLNQIIEMIDILKK
jgi:transcriptional regulator with XRE-family HTH domain